MQLRHPSSTVAARPARPFLALPDTLNPFSSLPMLPLSFTKGLALAAFVLAGAFTAPAAAQPGGVTPYGSGMNPANSLVLLSGQPAVGQSFKLGVRNTATTTKPAAFAYLVFATAPDANFPAGTVLKGFGLGAPGAKGELLVSLLPPNPLGTLGPVGWAGGVAPPAPFLFAIPNNPNLVGVDLYFQGTLITPSQGFSGSSLGLTNGLKVTVGWGLGTPPGMVAIPAGTFVMGSNAASGPPYYGNSSTQPVHPVTISNSFWMGRHEVTQSKYQALMGTNPSSFPGANNPVESMSWFSARAYCSALTAQQSSLGNVPLGYQYRLPTEAEWEYACRAGTTTEFNVGSALFCNQAKFFYSYHANPAVCSGWQTGTAPVGGYAPNAWGLYDMHGNVEEWCLDSYAAYGGAPVTDPFVRGGPSRVLRGGSWAQVSGSCRSAHRYGIVPSDTEDYIGFRVVLAPALVP